MWRTSQRLEFASRSGDNLLWRSIMKIRIVVHEAEEGGYWAEVPAIPGCATQGDSMDELMKNLYEAIEGCFFD